MIKLYAAIVLYCISSLIFATVDLPRINAEIDGDECRIVLIKYSGIGNYIYSEGNCQIIYDMCTEDHCTVKELEKKDLNFGKQDNIG